jgi:LmbE family N-acetylglucosaminyl deacetylase
METSTTEQLTADVVLGIGAHADDLDAMAGGTLAALAAGGAKVYYLILTDGCKGSADERVQSKELAKARQAEQRAAAKVIGAADVFFESYEDGALEPTMAVKKDIVKHIRKLQPDLVVAMDPTMLYDVTRSFINHPDHVAGGQAALAAVYPLARDRLSFPDLCDQGFMPHKVKTLLLTNFSAANYFVDIGETIDTKLRALEAHVSQMPGMKTTAQAFRRFAEQDGQKAGFQYAEGFVRIDIE